MFVGAAKPMRPIQVPVDPRRRSPIARGLGAATYSRNALRRFMRWPSWWVVVEVCYSRPQNTGSRPDRFRVDASLHMCPIGHTTNVLARALPPPSHPMPTLREAGTMTIARIRSVSVQLHTTRTRIAQGHHRAGAPTARVSYPRADPPTTWGPGQEHAPRWKG